MDWKQIIADLQSAGLTQQQIAGACGCSQTGIADLAHGRTKDPRYTLGEKILKLRQVKTNVPPARIAQAATETVAQGVA